MYQPEHPQRNTTHQSTSQTSCNHTPEILARWNCWDTSQPGEYDGLERQLEQDSRALDVLSGERRDVSAATGRWSCNVRTQQAADALDVRAGEGCFGKGAARSRRRLCAGVVALLDASAGGCGASGGALVGCRCLEDSRGRCGGRGDALEDLVDFLSNPALDLPGGHRARVLSKTSLRGGESVLDEARDFAAVMGEGGVGEISDGLLGQRVQAFDEALVSE
jgi:hypothetical protein